jgi:cytochrome b561
MQIRNDADSYGALARGLHWLSAILVLGAFGLGQTIDWFPKSVEASLKLGHAWTGLAVLALLVARLGWRLADRHPAAIPTALDPWLARAATLGRGALYALLVAAPVVGIVLTFARGETLSLFGLYDIASPWARDRAFARTAKEAHELVANGLMILAVLHAAAAALHHYVLGDDTLRRMLGRAASRLP